MPEILLVNPRKRGARKKKAKRKTTRRKNPMATRKKRRTAKQRAATRKLVALNKRRSSSKRRSNPVKRKKVTRRRATARRSPARRRRVRRRSNPALTMRSVQSQLMEAGTGAVGALGLGVIQGYLPIPANLKGGIVGTGVKALLAIGMGVVAQKTKIVKPATAAKLANGALTVVLYDELKGLVANYAPGIQMAEYLDPGMGYYGSGLTAGQIVDDPDALGLLTPSLETDSLTTQEDGFGEYIDDLSYV